MRRVRIIPILTISGNKLVKTVRFNKPNYLGDPINAIKIFNDKEVDEILVLDISVSKNNGQINFKLIEEMASECFMPLGYGGGIKNMKDVERLFSCGIEKIVLNSVLLTDPGFITKIAEKYGVQSVVVSLDIKKHFLGGVRPYFVSGDKSINKDIVLWAKEVESLGAGEIILNNIDRAGTFSGLDMQLIEKVSSAVSIPLVPCGGVNSLEDMLKGVKAGASAIAAGSFFVYKNNDTKSILINYPSQPELVNKIYNYI